MPTITRPGAGEYAEYYARYVDRVPQGDLPDLLARQYDATRALLGALPPDKGRYRYAPDKWSVGEVLGHLADSERVFAYRALRIARTDETPLPGFDQEIYVPAGRFDARALSDVLAEFGAVRAATLALIRGLPAESLERRGTASGYPVSVRGLLYIIAGHELHHVAVLKERYAIS